jgi:hypothetical protein
MAPRANWKGYLRLSLASAAHGLTSHVPVPSPRFAEPPPRKRGDYWNFLALPLPPDRALDGLTRAVVPLPGSHRSLVSPTAFGYLATAMKSRQS